LSRLGALRETAYEASADVAVDTGDLEVGEVVDAVLEAYAAVAP
jgi:hypothetical protein